MKEQTLLAQAVDGIFETQRGIIDEHQVSRHTASEQKRIIKRVVGSIEFVPNVAGIHIHATIQHKG